MTWLLIILLKDENVRTFLHVGDMWVTVNVPLHKLLTSGHDNLEENKEAHSIFSDDFLCMHYLIRLSKHLARKIYESKNLENTASKSWKRTNDPYESQTMSAISKIWKIMDGYTFYPTYIKISFLAAVYKQEWNCVPKRRWLYDVWWWITKKIFLNDNFALFMLSWLQKWNHLGVGVEFRVRFKNCLGVYTSSWPNFIFYVSFNSNLWFWFNYGAVFTFLEP